MLAKEVPARLATIPDLPQAVGILLNGKAAEPEVWQALIDAGQADSDELSWESLGRMLREDRFVSIWRRVSFMRFDWSVPTNDFIDDVMPFIADHPMKNVILLHGLNVGRDAAKYAQLANEVPLDDIEMSRWGIWKVVTVGDKKREREATQAAVRFADKTAVDLSKFARVLMPQDRYQASKQGMDVQRHFPAFVSTLVELEPTLTMEKLANYEKTEGHAPAVLRAPGGATSRWGSSRNPNAATRPI